MSLCVSLVIDVFRGVFR